MNKISDKGNLSEFSWRRQDFIDHGEEAPTVLDNDKTYTYGEAISEAELFDWLLETNKVLRLINDTDKTIFDSLYTEYMIDLEYLCKIGKIEESKMPELKEILTFEI